MALGFASLGVGLLDCEGIHKQQRRCFLHLTAVTEPPRRRYAPRTDDGLAQGMESVGTLVVFLGLGWLIDRWLGTQPVFMIAMVVLAVVGLGAKIYGTYTTRMKELEAQRLDSQSGGYRPGSAS